MLDKMCTLKNTVLRIYVVEINHICWHFPKCQLGTKLKKTMINCISSHLIGLLLSESISANYQRIAPEISQEARKVDRYKRCHSFPYNGFFCPVYFSVCFSVYLVWYKSCLYINFFIQAFANKFIFSDAANNTENENK